MKNAKDVVALLDALIEREDALIKTLQSMKASLCTEDSPKKVKESPATEETEPKKEEPTTEETKTYYKEEVRATLSQKAKINAECKVAAKALVAKYSTDGTLTGVPAESYADLMAELEVVGNA